MAGTKAGALKARDKNKAKYDAIYLEKYGMTFYEKIGSIGGKKGTTGGFYANRELVRRAGRLGGLKSRRTKVVA